MREIDEKSSSIDSYQPISAAFCVIVVVANLISAKMVPLPWLGFSLPAGLAIYPLTVLLNNIVTEVHGAQKTKEMIYIAFGANILAFGLVELALFLPGERADFESSFESVLGLSGLRIFASLAAFAVAQIADVQLYSLIRCWTGQRLLWLRSNAAAMVSQMVDTVVIDMVFLYWGMGMDFRAVAPVMLLSYLYKSGFSLACTPFFYFFVFLARGKPQDKQNSFKLLEKIRV